MNNRPTQEDDAQSQPEIVKELEEEESFFDDARSLIHWKEDETSTNTLRTPTLFHTNLSKKERFNAVMICKKLGIESLFSNLEVEHEYLSNDWYIEDDFAEDWITLLPMVFNAGCNLCVIREIDASNFSKVSISLGKIEFHHLTELKIDFVILDNLQFLEFLDAPLLFRLKIQNCNLTNTKALQKTNFQKIKSLTMKNHFIQRFEMLPRMRISTEKFGCNHTKANFLLLGIYSKAADYAFQVKIQSKDVISNIKANYKQELEHTLEVIVERFGEDQRHERTENWKQNYSLIERKCRNIFYRDNKQTNIPLQID